MAYVERKLVLRNGPPWGFRLYEDTMHGLMVSKIRRRSPAELAGMMEGDQVLAINGYESTDMSHNAAVQIIDYAAYTLEMVVGRYERMQQRMETIYLDNTALRSRQIPQEITTTELQLFWDKGTPLKPVRMQWPPPPPPPPATISDRIMYVIPSARPVPPSSPPPAPKQTFVWKSSPIQILPTQKPKPVPAPARAPPPVQVTHVARVPSPQPLKENLILPNDPDVTSVSVERLMREFDAPPIAPELKKKAYADSSFYSDPAKYYPTIEEQIEMARRVADSLQDPDNMFSRGVNIFEKQRQRAEKYVREGPEPEHDPIAEATPEQLKMMTPPSPPPPPPPPPPSFPGLQPVNQSAIPPPPPLLPGQPKTVQEFLEKIKVFPTSGHDVVDPQKCFDIATALYKSDSRGAEMFARRHARAKKWEAEAENKETDSQKPKPVMAAPPHDTGYKQKLLSKVATANPPPHRKVTLPVSSVSQLSNVTPLTQQNALQKRKISLIDDQDSSWSDSKMDFSDVMPRPFGQAVLPSYGTGDTNMLPAPAMSEINLSENSVDDRPSGWRPVKFNVPVKTE